MWRDRGERKRREGWTERGMIEEKRKGGIRVHKKKLGSNRQETELRSGGWGGENLVTWMAIEKGELKGAKGTTTRQLINGAQQRQHRTCTIIGMRYKGTKHNKEGRIKKSTVAR